LRRGLGQGAQELRAQPWLRLGRPAHGGLARSLALSAIHRITAVRHSTLALLARLPEPEILRPRMQDRWSLRDALGHLLSCDEETLRRFRLIERRRGDVWLD